ncbi:MAG: trimeric intracellular cation channel family protein [Bacteroidetes bacterium]|nr:trimeric intracellular cation channel family protein [Bacteroidota bacterium]
MQIQYVLELLGTGFFAISGALAANDKAQPDWFGASFIGFITSIGGGSLRDILLGSRPLVWINDINFMYAIIIGVILASVFFSTLIKLRRTFFLFDTVGIAMFTIVGTEKALSLGVNPVIAAIMGMFSAVMGGVLRDVLTNEIPIIFKKEIYATACLVGAIVYLGLDYLGCERNVNFLVSALLIIAIRIIAVKKNLSLPKFIKQKNSEV